MQTGQLEAVVAVTEAGSFRRAAERLGRSQPALTKAVRALEQTLGVTIFDRSPRGVRLTAAGDRIYRRARTVLADLTVLRDEATQMAGQGGGLVRVGISPVGGTAILPEALRGFRRRWPGVEVDLILVLYPESAAMLRDAALDLVVGPVPDLAAHDALAVELLFEMDFVVVTHAANPRRDVTQLGEIAPQDWIRLGPREGPSGLFAIPESPLPEALTRCDSLSATLAIIAGTGAFCVLSRNLYEAHRAGHDLVQVPVQDTLPGFGLSLLTRKDRPLTPAAADLASWIRRQAGAAKGF